MPQFKRILCPVDLSPASPKVFPFAASLAEKYDAHIRLLFVARVFKFYENIYVPSVSIHAFEQDLMKGAEKRMAEFVRDCVANPDRVRQEVLCGDPGDEIVSYVVREKMDLVVIGTHGRKGLDHVVFGSVAEHVVKHSPVPVLTVNPYRP